MDRAQKNHIGIILLNELPLHAWHRHAALLLILAIVGLACVLFLPTLTSLIGAWEGERDRSTYEHGYLIVALSGWLLFRDREAFTKAPIKPVPLALIVVAALSMAWVVVHHAGIQLGGQALLPLIILAAVYAAAGREVTRLAAFPVLYLYFAIPVWDVLLSVLQTITTQVNGVVLSGVGIPVLIEGNRVHIPAGSFEVEEGCSGLHYVITALALATLIGEVYRVRWQARLKLLLLAGAIGLLTNWVRVFCIIVAGQLTDMQHFLITKDHYWFGWGLFVIGIAAFIWVSPRWTRDVAPTPVASGPGGRLSWAAGIAALAMLAVGPALSLASARAAPADKVTMTQPAVSGWIDAGAYEGPWQPRFDGAHGEHRTRYLDRESGLEVILYSAVYLRQKQGQELAGFRNSVIAGSVRAARRPRAHEEGGLRYQSGEFLDGEQRYAVRWSYIVGGRSFADTFASQLWYGVSTLWSDPSSWVIAVAVPCDAAGCESANQLAASASKSFIPPIVAGGSIQEQE